MQKMDFSSMSVEDLRVPDLKSEKEKQEYLDAMFAGEVPIPPIYKAMGVDFTAERYVDAVLRKVKAIGVLSAAAPGHEVMKDDMSAMSKGARISRFLQANIRRQREQTDYVRERNPYGIFGENVMLKLTGSRKAVREAGESKKVDFVGLGAGIPDERDLRQFEQNPHMGLVAIVSTVVAARGIMRLIKNNKIDIKRIMFAVEDPNTAGAHLGAKEEHLGTPRHDPSLISEQLHNHFPNIPRILAGGIAYRDGYNNRALGNGYQGGGVGIRGLFTKESELTEELMGMYYFDRKYKTVVNRNSPTGYLGRFLDVPRHVQSREEIEAYVKWAVANCIACINMKECTFLQTHVNEDGVVDPDLESEIFCIGQDLPRTTRGEEGGTVFSSTMRDVIIDDEIYYDDDGNFDCPSLEKSHNWWTTHDSPQRTETDAL